MKEDEKKSSRELIRELDTLRKRVAELEASQSSSRESQRALQQIEQRYQSLVNNVNIGIYRNTGGPQGVFLQANPAIAEMFGYDSVDEFKTVHVSDLYLDPADRQKFVDAILEKGFVTEKEIKLKRKDGTPIWGAVTAKIHYDENENINWIDGVIEDITERKLTEERLRESEERFRQLYRSSRDALMTLEPPSWKFTSGNPAAIELFGVRGEAEFISLGPWDISPEKQPDGRASNEKAVEMITTAMQQGSYFFEWTHKQINGDTFPATVLLTRMNIAGEVFLQATVRDITEQKKAEAELHRIQRQRLDRLKGIGTLAGGIAHDFNNILMGIFGNISIAKLDLGPGHPAMEFLEKAENSLNRAVRLSNQLLTFAKGGEPVIEEASLDRVVEESVRFDLSGSKVRPVFDKPDDLWMAEVDEGQIQQVFSNLAINAAQAMPDVGHLYITMENVEFSNETPDGLPSGKYIRVTVRDEGMGIDPKHLDRIFDPYFSTKPSGSGLGLATTHSIISKHGGAIRVESEAGSGTTFELFLPASSSVKPRKTPIPLPKDLEGLQGARILLMDDEEVVRKVTGNMLRKSGFHVVTAADGSEAIRIYNNAMEKDNPFDIVITDLTVPGGMGGQETVEKILEINPEAVVIISSGYADDPVMANYEKYGFKGIVPKPYTLETLLNALGRLFQK